MKTNVGKPLGDRVLLKIIEDKEKKSSGGIILRESEVKTAEVVAVSDGFPAQNGERIRLEVEVGDVVMITGGINSTKVRQDGEIYHLVRESDILMILDGKE